MRIAAWDLDHKARLKAILRKTQHAVAGLGVDVLVFNEFVDGPGPGWSDSGSSRKDRQGCEYGASVPDVSVGRTFRLDGSVAADVADAERAITALDATAAALANTEALARLLLRAESVASSFIEGLVVGGRRLLRAESARAVGEADTDVTAQEVLGNIDAMTWAIESLSTAEAVTVDGLLHVHECLLARTRLREHAGRIRSVQNWIGGSSFAQAAIAHGQLETRSTPFVGGNGCTRTWARAREGSIGTTGASAVSGP